MRAEHFKNVVRVALIILTLQFNVKCKKSFLQDLNLVVLFYFDIMQSINVNPGLSFSARCSLACPSIFYISKCKNAITG